MIRIVVAYVDEEEAAVPSRGSTNSRTSESYVQETRIAE
jgi:hypothetical protein